MERVTFTAEARDTSTKGRNSQLRASGMVPAVLYGMNVDGAISIKLNEKDIVKMSRKGLRTLLFDLEFAGQHHAALVKDYMVDDITRKLLHVDFLAINPSEPIEVDLPIHLNGIAAGTKVGGRLEQRLFNIRVKGLAEDIPSSVDVDVTAAEIGELVHVRDLDERPGIVFETPGQVTIFVVRAPRRVEETTTAEGGAAAEGGEGAEGEGAETSAE
ncbi:MAG TPA: 50S ribosomal protein L25 [Caldisericia bacterium]|nr:50S ribosomal protein L25 [Caldisericia bacterium]HPF49666.1 50S ribosomal protein L25 [Caldisericia bacterium]HPI84561.1 50S ribosomal protein L25 [Caldisericia bacterium]HPQ93676.1 50S ribosomal protein L25 [Caldisericia bacterium]HRV74760.1 50S ribosomal protein L25 [Caldisericia bacterium]